MIELHQSRSRSKVHYAKLEKLKGIKIWPDKWMILNLDYFSRIFKVVSKFLGCIIDGSAPSDKRTLKTQFQLLYY